MSPVDFTRDTWDRDSWIFQPALRTPRGSGMAYQHYWCCAHHPGAIENFFLPRTTCEWGCHTQGLRWHDHGKSPLPKSWSA